MRVDSKNDIEATGNVEITRFSRQLTIDLEFADENTAIAMMQRAHDAVSDKGSTLILVDLSDGVSVSNTKVRARVP